MHEATPEPAAMVAILGARAGFSLTPAQCADYTEAYGHIAAMAALLDRAASYMDEPAHVYAYNPETGHE